MYCVSCALVRNPIAGVTHCTGCGGELVLDTDDFFRHKVGNLFREVRPAQQQMAETIEKALQKSAATVVCEAPVGTGKTFGYMLPMILKIGAEQIRSKAERPEDVIAVGERIGKDIHRATGRHAAAPSGAMRNVIAKSGRTDTVEKVPFRVIVSTAKKTLQDQLVNQDLPALRAATGVNFKYAIRKGANAYACKLRINGAVKTIDSLTTKARAMRNEERMIWDARSGIAKIAEWVETSDSADFATYPVEIDEPLRRRLDASDCLGTDCPLSDECAFRQSRVNAAQSDVLVCNHHLFGMDSTMAKRILGDRHAIVIDEAHQLEEAMRSALTATVTSRSIEWLNATIGDIYNPHKSGRSYKLPHGDDLAAKWDTCFNLIDGQVGIVNPRPFGAAGDEALAGLVIARQQLLAWFEQLGCIVKERAVNDETGPEVRYKKDYSIKPVGDEHMDTYLQLWRVYRSIQMLHDSLATLQDEEAALESVIYVEVEDKITRINVAPVSMAKACYYLWAETQYVVITSGTITTSGDFGPIRDMLGLGEIEERPSLAEGLLAATAQPTTTRQIPRPIAVRQPAKSMTAAQGAGIASGHAHFPRKPETLTLPSPFDFANRAMLYTPLDMPLPVSAPEMGEDANDYLARRAKYVEEITKRMFVLMRVAQGNTFVLFTSQKEMLEAQAQLEVYNKSPKNKVPLEFIAQGDNPALTLRRFMETPNGVLLGLKSFWEGVDVQGDKLRLVVIPKLPFAPPNDPVLMAKERLVRARALERKESVDPGALFQQLQVPPMITNMRQAAGRLIRSKSDRGVCAILDPRIWTGSSSKKPYATQTAYYGYGKTLVTALGFPGRTSVLNDAQLFLHWIATNPNA